MKSVRIEFLTLLLTVATFSNSYSSRNDLFLTEEERQSSISVTSSQLVSPAMSPSLLTPVQKLEGEIAALEELPSSRLNNMLIGRKKIELEQARLSSVSSATTLGSLPNVVVPIVVSAPIRVASSASSSLTAQELRERLEADSSLPTSRVVKARMASYQSQLRAMGEEEWTSSVAPVSQIVSLVPSAQGESSPILAPSSSVTLGSLPSVVVPNVVPNTSSAPIRAALSASSSLTAQELRERLEVDSKLPTSRVIQSRMALYQSQLRAMGEGEWTPSVTPVPQIVPMGTSGQVGSSSQTSEYLSDLELAMRLQEEENRGGDVHLPGVFIPQIAMSVEDARAYEQMTNALRIQVDSDVHALTRAAGGHYPTIKRLEQKYLHYTDQLTAQNILDGRTRFLADLDGPEFRHFFTLPTEGVSQVQQQIAREFAAHERNVRALLETNRGFWNQGVNDVDGETQQSLRDVFAHAYQAACALDRVRGDMEYRGYFCLQLSDNYTYNGGCHPGITGRLIELYRQILAIGLGE